MLWNKRITAFLILILLVSTFVVASHHHADTADYDDCPICVVSLHQQATGQSTVFFNGIPSFTETKLVVVQPSFTFKLLSFSLNNRAPPA